MRGALGEWSANSAAVKSISPDGVSARAAMGWKPLMASVIATMWRAMGRRAFIEQVAQRPHRVVGA